MRAPALQWMDGRSTAAGAAAAVKRCDVASVHDSTLLDEAGAALVAAVYSVLNGDQVRECALPANFSGLRFARYRVGDEYGWHTDDAYNAQGFRADLSFTLMLGPATRGGELSFLDGGGGSAEQFDLDAGDLVVYPSTMPHAVARVLAGERMVLIGWIQSFVRDHGQRALLAELHRMATKESERQPERLQAVRNELLRRWGG